MTVTRFIFINQFSYLVQHNSILNVYYVIQKKPQDCGFFIVIYYYYQKYFCTLSINSVAFANSNISIIDIFEFNSFAVSFNKLRYNS
ncbi:hypothetical protein CLV55_10573 [Flavobacterium aciduliphilum]|uniref:Uncharacterized protein n=1 Tax=Flavobacterium aciduliphilum TaxID=1101402 RepID=A0A328YR03_9FLAO|nr:hypothetical protein CLV55_10573 [Flavobacterium aciduliphilum]